MGAENEKSIAMARRASFAFFGALTDQGRTFMGAISPRLLAIVDALPLRPGLRVLEIGCGPGAAARAVAERIGNGHVLALDRSSRAIAQAIAASAEQIEAGVLSFRQVAIEHFQLERRDRPYDLAFAVRVGALDGRHPEILQAALVNIRGALRQGGRLFIDGGEPLREIALHDVQVV